MSKYPGTSVHHINARSREGVDHPDNLVRLDNKIHQRLHCLLENRLFHEQVEFLESIAHTALQKRFASDIHQVIGDNAGDMYKSHTFNKKSGIYIPNYSSHD